MYIDPTGHMNYFTQTHHFVLGYSAGTIEVYNDNMPLPFMKLGVNPLDEINKTIEFYQSIYDLGHGLYTGNIGLDELKKMVGHHISDALWGDISYIIENHEILKCGVKATNEEVYEFGKRVPRTLDELAKIGLTVKELAAIVKNGIKRGFGYIVREGVEDADDVAQGTSNAQYINGIKVIKTEGNVIHLENGTNLYKNRFGYEDFSNTNIKNLEIKNINGKYKDYRGYTANKEYIYVIDENNNLITSYSDDVIHHSDLVKGGNVKYAGELKFKNGKLEYWNNNSGHYQPLAGDAINIVDIMRQNGITDASMDNFIGVTK